MYRLVVLTLVPVAVPNVRLTRFDVVAKRLVVVILVKIPVEGVEPPIGTLLIDPPVSVSVPATIASVIESAGNASTPDTDKLVVVTDVPLAVMKERPSNKPEIPGWVVETEPTFALLKTSIVVKLPLKELTEPKPVTVSPVAVIPPLEILVARKFVVVTEVLDTLGTLKTFVVVLKVKVGVPVTVLSEFPKPTKVLLRVVVPEPLPPVGHEVLQSPFKHNCFV